MNGTLRHEGNRHTLRFERNLDHPPEKVWRAITDPGEMAYWFPAEMQGERRQGASLRFVFPAEPGQTPAQSEQEGPAFEGRILAFEPPGLLEFSWGVEVLRFELQEGPTGTLLVFTHTFEDEAKSARDACGWEYCLSSLERRLQGLPQLSFDESGFDKKFAEYARAFGPEASSKRGPYE
jgi:uncharacterized protein YndB with AHSA1/START domain